MNIFAQKFVSFVKDQNEKKKHQDRVGTDSPLSKRTTNIILLRPMKGSFDTGIAQSDVFSLSDNNSCVSLIYWSERISLSFFITIHIFECRDKIKAVGSEFYGRMIFLQCLFLFTYLCVISCLKLESVWKSFLKE